MMGNLVLGNPEFAEPVVCEQLDKAKKRGVTSLNPPGHPPFVYPLERASAVVEKTRWCTRDEGVKP